MRGLQKARHPDQTSPGKDAGPQGTPQILRWGLWEMPRSLRPTVRSQGTRSTALVMTPLRPLPERLSPSRLVGSASLPLGPSGAAWARGSTSSDVLGGHRIHHAVSTAIPPPTVNLHRLCFQSVFDVTSCFSLNPIIPLILLWQL